MRKEYVKSGLFAVLSFLLILCFCSAAGADDTPPITIELSFDKTSVNVGETIQAVYSVSGGSGSFTKIEYHWDIFSDGSWTEGPAVGTAETSGTISYTPESGSELRLEVYAKDSNGHEKWKSSVRSIRTPDVTEPISIEINYEKSPVFSGETVRADYTISGGTGIYTDIRYRWDIYEEPDGWINGTAVQTAETSASLSFTPENGTQVRLWISVTDSEGNMKGYSKGLVIMAREILLVDYPSSIRAGERFTLYAGISDGTEDTFSFESMDPSIVTVDAGGHVLGIAQGTASVVITGNETGLTRTIEITVTTSEPDPLTASMGKPSYSTAGSGSSVTYTLTFQTDAAGGVSPYTFYYTLYRDNKAVHTSTRSSSAFTVSGSSLGVEGLYTAKAVVEDSRGVKTVTWSSGYFRKGSSSDATGDILMDDPDFVLPADIITLEAGSFEGTSASAVYIPDSCTSIGNSAFADCARLTQIRIPQNCAVAADAFSGCPYVTIFGVKGSPAEEYAISHDSQVRFIPDEP